MKGSHISLFSGVGMTDLAVERAGFKTIATAEVDPFCRRVLQARNPGAMHFHDVKEVSVLDDQLRHAAANRGLKPLLISGGFPCQDVSAIGAGVGLSGARSGLWGEFARVIREFQPEYVFIENSPLLRTRGLATVLADLWTMGYDAQWDCIPAAAVGAPHLRDRIFIVAQQSSGRSLPVNGQYIGTADRSLRGIVGNAVRLTRCGYMQAGDVYMSRAAAPIREAKRGILASPGNRATRLYPTPRSAANEWRTTRNAPSHGKGHGKTLAGELNDLERADGIIPGSSSESCGNVNPRWVEWLMGLPPDWTNPDISNNSLAQHGGWGIEPKIPRTLTGVKNRRGRLMALGNGMVPQAAAIPLGWLP